MPRCFKLYRSVDVSGVSGTGVIAEGVVFSSGAVALHWLTGYFTTGIYPSIESVEAIHGHAGSTLVVYEDELQDGQRWAFLEPANSRTTRPSIPPENGSRSRSPRTRRPVDGRVGEPASG